MIKSRMQLNALIRNKAAGDGDKAQILLRIYMMERLLERISVSSYRDNFILKGGMLVSSLVGVDMRTTMDIDTTVRALTLTPEKAKAFLEEIMAIDLEDNVSFKITKVEDIMEGHEYEGIRFHIEGSLEKLRQTIKIDISTGDVITPAAVEYELPLILEDRKIGLWAYNMETLLAEKLETVMTRAEANTRMRDFYDIYVLTRQEAIEINPTHLKEAFAATCRRRGTETIIPFFDEVLDSIEALPEMQDAWENYRKNNSYVEELSWGEVVHSVKLLKDRIG